MPCSAHPCRVLHIHAVFCTSMPCSAHDCTSLSRVRGRPEFIGRPDQQGNAHIRERRNLAPGGPRMQAAGLQCIILQIAVAFRNPQIRACSRYGGFPDNPVAQVQRLARGSRAPLRGCLPSARGRPWAEGPKAETSGMALAATEPLFNQWDVLERDLADALRTPEAGSSVIMMQQCLSCQENNQWLHIRQRQQCRRDAAPGSSW